MLTSAERRVLRTFQEFLITPGQMLCFTGPVLQRDRMTLEQLVKKDMVVRESFKGAYSLTHTGFAAMNGRGEA